MNSKKKLEALKACGSANPNMNLTGLKKYIQSDKYLLNDYDVGMKLISNHGKFFSEFLIGEEVVSDLVDNKDFVLQAVKRYALNLQFVSERLRNDPDVVERAVDTGSRKRNVFRYASFDLRNSDSIILSAIVKNPESILFSELLYEKYLFDAIGYCRTIEQVKSILCEDKYQQMMSGYDFRKKVVKANGLCLSLCSEEERNQKEFARLSLKCTHSFNSYRYFGEKIRKDSEFMRDICRKHPSYVLHLPKNIIADPNIDREFVEAILGEGGVKYLRLFHTSILKDFNLLCVAVKSTFGNRIFVDWKSNDYARRSLHNRFLLDYEKSLELVRNFLPLSLVLYKWKDDLDYVLKAIEYNPKNIICTRGHIEWSADFLKKAVGVNIEVIRGFGIKESVFRIYDNLTLQQNGELYFEVLKGYGIREELVRRDLEERIGFLRKEEFEESDEKEEEQHSGKTLKSEKRMKIVFFNTDVVFIPIYFLI